MAIRSHPKQFKTTGTTGATTQKDLDKMFLDSHLYFESTFVNNKYDDGVEESQFDNYYEI